MAIAFQRRLITPQVTRGKRYGLKLTTQNHSIRQATSLAYSLYMQAGSTHKVSQLELAIFQRKRSDDYAAAPTKKAPLSAIVHHNLAAEADEFSLKE